jgi:hypothetical protein
VSAAAAAELAAAALALTLLPSPSLPQVVIAPHVYGPGVTFNHKNHAGGPHWNRLTNSIGYFTKAGYCSNGARRGLPGARATPSCDCAALRAIWLCTCTCS